MSALPASETAPASPPENDVDPEAAAFGARVFALLHRAQAGANWFYWVAAFSLINTAIVHLKGDLHFVIGLGATLIVDVMSQALAQQNPAAETTLRIIAIGIDVLLAGMFFFFGWFAGRGRLIAFSIGMLLYLLDGMLFLLVQDWLSVAFHAFVLYSMGQGFAAFRELKRMGLSIGSPPPYEGQSPPVPPESPDEGPRPADVAKPLDRY